jgi:polyisoprenyl-phosphate glycosyltransferase
MQILVSHGRAGIDGRLVHDLRSNQERLSGGFFFFLVDDGSTDGTWQAITSQIAGYPRIIAIKLSRNFGHQVALTAGLPSAKARSLRLDQS